MFGSLGFPEILLILVLALLIFGPKRLPEVGRTIGKGLSEFRRASSDLKRTVNAELALDEDERPASPRRPDLSGPAGSAAARTAALRQLPDPGGPPEATAARMPVEPETAGTEPPLDLPTAAAPSGAEPGEEPPAEALSEAEPADEPTEEAGDEPAATTTTH